MLYPKLSLNSSARSSKIVFLKKWFLEYLNQRFPGTLLENVDFWIPTQTCYMKIAGNGGRLKICFDKYSRWSFSAQ